MPRQVSAASSPPLRSIALATILAANAGAAWGQAATAPSATGVSSSLFSGQTARAAPPAPPKQDPHASRSQAPTSIYGSTPPPRNDRRPLGEPTDAARLGRPPTLQSGGLPVFGLERRTDPAPICRSACASRYYACGPGGGECVAARGTCLQSCAASRTEWGRFGVPPQ